MSVKSKIANFTGKKNDEQPKTNKANTNLDSKPPKYTDEIHNQKSVPFIRTTKDKWGLARDINPNIHGDIPTQKNVKSVISCIGTSRDGKSTFLNLMADYIHKKENVQNPPQDPFHSKQSDDAVTNGIDYFYAGNYLLLDCQGMQLEDAKYDHYLAVISYLMSDVLIFTVRQRLDLQVLNNLLSLFCFLSEIPEGSRKKTKSQLIIRIKDFQNVKDLKNDDKYLEKLVNKWLEKSNDQHDQIKEAIKQTFIIIPVATFSPRYDDDKYEDQILDIYSKTFANYNPSFIKACELVYESSKMSNVTDLLKGDNLVNLVNDLIKNGKMDYKKLDLYHNITKVELLEYIGYSLNVANSEQLDKTIINKMDGSNQASLLVRDRKILIEKLYGHAFNIKFKDVPFDIKYECFNKTFLEFWDIHNQAKQSNINRAENMLQPHWIKFNEKFNVPYFSGLVNGIVDFFTPKKDELYKFLATLDANVRDKYKTIVEHEEIELKKTQDEILRLNKKHLLDIDGKIIKYDIDANMIRLIDKYISGIDVVNKNYNCKYLEVIKPIVDEIVREVTKIVNDNKKTYYINKNKEIVTNNAMEYDIELNINKLSKHLKIHNNKWTTSNDFNSRYLAIKGRRLNDIGFLLDVNYDIHTDMSFVDFGFDNCNFTVTDKVFKKIEQIMIKFLEDNKYLTTVEIQKKEKLLQIRYESKTCTSKAMSPYKQKLLEDIEHKKLLECLIRFCKEGNYELC